MDYITFSLILVFGALIGAYTMAFQGATQYWGRKLVDAPDESEIIAQKVAEGMPEAEARGFAMGHAAYDRGAQDGITPKSQNFRNILFFACLLFGLIGGWILFKWYIGIAAFIGTCVATAILKSFFPKDDSEFFRKRIRKQLYLRCETHKAEGDSLRVVACQHFLTKLDENG